jgi:hypothetical protein
LDFAAGGRVNGRPYAAPSGRPLLAEPLAGAPRAGGECDGAAGCALRAGEAADLLLNNTEAQELALHVHGNVFWALATSLQPGAEALHAPDHVRRDVVSVPARGWARVRLVADNPGLWLLEDVSRGAHALVLYVAPELLRASAGAGALLGCASSSE